MCMCVSGWVCGICMQVPKEVRGGCQIPWGWRWLWANMTWVWVWSGSSERTASHQSSLVPRFCRTDYTESVLWWLADLLLDTRSPERASWVGLPSSRTALWKFPEPAFQSSVHCAKTIVYFPLNLLFVCFAFDTALFYLKGWCKVQNLGEHFGTAYRNDRDISQISWSLQPVGIAASVFLPGEESEIQMACKFLSSLDC